MSTFRLHSGDTEFNTRVDALFSSLQSAAKDLEPQLKREHAEEDLKEEEEEEGGRKRQCFSRPQGRPPQWRGRGGRGGGGGGRGLGPRNNTPDYIKNPERWTRYKMSDTKVLSDSDNKKEGLRLLADLSRRSDNPKTEDDQPMEADEDKPKFVFKKPAVPPMAKTLNPKPEEEPEPQSSLLITSRKFQKPEYVVGKAKQKSKVTKVARVTKEEEEEEEVGGEGRKKEEVKLSYLMFDEED